jgi:hypothetical protein
MKLLNWLAYAFPSLSSSINICSFYNILAQQEISHNYETATDSKCSRLKTSQGHDRNIFKIITPSPRRKILYFHFFELPGELRNIVYKHVLTTPEIIYVMRYYWVMTECTRYKLEPPLLSLAVKLLCSNKQINEEGTGILYEHNTFGFRLEYCFQAVSLLVYFAFDISNLRL